MKFTIIHASYGRREMCSLTKNKWKKTFSGEHEIEYIVSVDKVDPSHNEYVCHPDLQDIVLISNVTNTSVAAINIAAAHSTGDIMIVVSDDFEPIPNWDLEILKAVGDHKDWILKTQDGIQKWIITLPIMDRIYYDRFGYIYHPSYTHMFCDTELTCVADLLGRKIKSDLLFKHNHYSIGGENGTVKKDLTSEKADSTWNQGERLFSERAREQFNLIGPYHTIEDRSIINYMRMRYAFWLDKI